MADDRRARLRDALSLFVLALGVRLLFWRATPDASWGWSASFKGDAPIWLAYAQALLRGEPFELGLPLRPPGMAYLLALLWDGQLASLPWLRLLWAVQGALLAPLLYVAAAPGLGARVARAAGWLLALATGPMLLSSSLNNETPYLVLVLGGFALFERARESTLALAGWCALQALACLFRVEHLLFVLLALPLLARAPRRRLTLGLAAFVLPLVPWHVSAWKAIDWLNSVEPRRPPATEAALRSVEQTIADVRWSPEAETWRAALPAFSRRSASVFVAATVRWRGGREVLPAHTTLLQQAFGYTPEPLPRFPFVAVYGPLNLALANHVGSTGGFDRGPLEQPPPLAGGHYPPFLVAGLPPSDLALEYPPHLRLVVRGDAVAAEWIRREPLASLRLAFRKLVIFWQGAAMGLTGWNLPLGLSGSRRAVDFVTPDSGPFVLAWRAGLLALVIASVWHGRRVTALQPWLLYAASKLLVTVLFFGYARQGALIVPVLALLAARSAEPWLPTRRLAAWLALPLALEAARLLANPAVQIDGRPVLRSDPWPEDLHRDQRVEFRAR